MRKLRDILRLRLQAELSMRQIRDCLRAIQNIVSQAQDKGLSWQTTKQLDDQSLAHLLYPESDTRVSNYFQMPDWGAVDRELKRKGVTKHLLWEEYTQQFPNCSYSYAQYCHLYLEWQGKQQRSMPQSHRAGEILFVDYASQMIPVVSGSSWEGRMNTEFHVAGELASSKFHEMVNRNDIIWETTMENNFDYDLAAATFTENNLLEQAIEIQPKKRVDLE
jgi:hypothetical protein